MLDFDFFHARYKYDPISGLLTWRINTKGGGRAIPIGTVAGSTVQTGHRRVMLSINRDGKQRMYKAHRVIWLMMTGEWPRLEIDHIDGDGTNNAWANLRLATRSQNNMNKRMQSNNSSGFKGVRRNGSGWSAQIWLDRKGIWLGTFRTKQEAHAICCEARIKAYGPFVRNA